jgi:hypothetical protein
MAVFRYSSTEPIQGPASMRVARGKLFHKFSPWTGKEGSGSIVNNTAITISLLRRGSEHRSAVALRAATSEISAYAVTL